MCVLTDGQLTGHVTLLVPGVDGDVAVRLEDQWTVLQEEKKKKSQSIDQSIQVTLQSGQQGDTLLLPPGL